MKILLLDDSYEFTDPTKDLLEKDGHIIEVISNSDKAFENLGKSYNYDLILLDLMFIVGDKFKLDIYPEVGILFYKKIRESNNKIPIIIISALSFGVYMSYLKTIKTFII